MSALEEGTVNVYVLYTAAYGHVTMAQCTSSTDSLDPLLMVTGKVTSSSVSHFILLVMLVRFLIWSLARSAWRASVLCKGVGQI